MSATLYAPYLPGGLQTTHHRPISLATDSSPIPSLSQPLTAVSPPSAAGPLKEVKNTIIATPHASYYSEASFTELREMAATEIRRAIVGHSLRNCVNKEYLNMASYGDGLNGAGAPGLPAPGAPSSYYPTQMQRGVSSRRLGAGG